MARAVFARALVATVVLAALVVVDGAVAQMSDSAIGERPTWHPGDRWTFAWRTGEDAGTREVEVLRAKEISAVRYYVVRIGAFEVYLTTDLHWAASVRDSVVESRVVPPRRWFGWPLAVGDEWEQRSVYEAANVKTPQLDYFAVVKSEVIEVPAGRFRALKVVRRDERGDFDEYWYAPEVRWYVRWTGRRGTIEFEERLTGFAPAPPPRPAP